MEVQKRVDTRGTLPGGHSIRNVWKCEVRSESNLRRFLFPSKTKRGMRGVRDDLPRKGEDARESFSRRRRISCKSRHNINTRPFEELPYWVHIE